MPCLVALLIIGGSFPAGRDVVVRVQSPAGAVSCVASESARHAAGQTLSCGGAGIEPFDVPADRVAPAARAALPARNVTLEAGWADTATVIEWLAVEEKGTRPLARRREVVGARLTVPVADRPRVIRLRPQGAAPQSVYVPPGASPPALRLAAPAPGGELFGRLPRRAFAPEALELVATGGTPLLLRPGEAGVFRASGLSPGTYALVPRYRGGLAGRPLSVVIRVGETTEVLPFDVPETAAVRFDLPDDACRARPASRVVLRGPGPQAAPRATATLRPVANEPACHQDVHGLEGGAYEASLVRGEGRDVLASSRFTATAGTVTPVALVPAVRVEGRVTFGAEFPAPGVRLRFEGAGAGASATSDADGFYALSLAGPGAYHVTLRASEGVPAVEFTRPLRTGTQREDFSLGDGIVKARARREDGEPLQEPVEVTLIAKGGERVTGSWDPAEGEARFAGLKRGAYAVTASTASGLATPTVTPVEVSPQAPVVEVDLVLARRELRLSVFDAAGVPVAGARAAVNGAPLAAEEPGVFRLAGVPPGAQLSVQAAGYVPLCRVLPDTEVPDLRVVLPASSESVTLHFVPGTNWESALLVGLPGSDCPVGIDQVDLQARAGRDETLVVLRLAGGTFSLGIGPRSYSVSVPGDLQVPHEP